MVKLNNKEVGPVGFGLMGTFTLSINKKAC